MKATPVPFDRAAEYSDGLAVSVIKIQHSKITDVGPGAITGSPLTTFELRFSNESQRPLDLNTVVVSAFSASGQQATPLYPSGVYDFSGSVSPGTRSSATYGFAISRSDLKTTTLVVDFDGAHSVAVFRGTAVR